MNEIPPPQGPGEIVTSFLRTLRDGLDSGLDLPEALARGAAGVPRETRERGMLAARRIAGDYREDEWGFDEEFAESVFPILEFLYDRWWRVQTKGIENVPAHGRALLAAQPRWGPAVGRDDDGRRRAARAPAAALPALPRAQLGVRAAVRVDADPPHRRRGRLAVQRDAPARAGPARRSVPRGREGQRASRTHERYRLQRFGRGGFVEIALRTGAPIVPVAVVGSEEIYPKLGESTLLARATGAPYFPLTPTFPWLGPLGIVPLPSKWRIEYCEPIEVAHHGPDAADDRALVLELSEQVRDVIQQKVYENLVARGPAFV